jgi:hypothetical protein
VKARVRACAAAIAVAVALAHAGVASAGDPEAAPVALESALKAATLADDPVLGMMLVERGESRPKDPRVEAASKKARDKFQNRAGRLSVSCPDERGCTAKHEGAAIELGKNVWVRPGPQRIEVTIAGKVATHTVDVGAGGMVDFVPPAPPRETAPPPAPATTAPPPVVAPQPGPIAPPPRADKPVEKDRGIHPAWFITGAVITAALGGVTIWSGLDTLSKHDDFEKGDDSAKGPGEAAQLRTNLLIGGTLLAATGTGITAIFVDWGGSDATASAPFPRGVAIRLRY